jgi:hypothetical protein
VGDVDGGAPEPAFLASRSVLVGRFPDEAASDSWSTPSAADGEVLLWLTLVAFWVAF